MADSYASSVMKHRRCTGTCPCSVTCPECGAKPGYKCVGNVEGFDAKTEHLNTFHTHRTIAFYQSVNGVPFAKEHFV